MEEAVAAVLSATIAGFTAWKIARLNLRSAVAEAKEAALATFESTRPERPEDPALSSGLQKLNDELRLNLRDISEGMGELLELISAVARAATAEDAAAGLRDLHRAGFAMLRTNHAGSSHDIVLFRVDADAQRLDPVDSRVHDPSTLRAISFSEADGAIGVAVDRLVGRGLTVANGAAFRTDVHAGFWQHVIACAEEFILSATTVVWDGALEPAVLLVMATEAGGLDRRNQEWTSNVGKIFDQTARLAVSA